MKYLVSVLAAAVSAAAVLVTADEKPADVPVAKLQGKWVEMIRDPQGKTYKVVKLIIEGKKETVFRYDGETLIHQHTVDFEVKKTEHVTIFTFQNLVVTAGPNKGAVQKEPVSYLYQVNGDHLFYAMGLMNDDKQPPSVGMCQRVKEDPAKLQ